MVAINISMPTSCKICKFKGSRLCFIDVLLGMEYREVPQEGKPNWCPLAEIKEEGGWHSVAKEGNPKESGFYLWTSKDGTVREDYYQVRDDTWSKAWQFGYKVIAWKKEPEPYEEEEA